MLQTLIQWFISLTGEAQIMAIVGVMGMLGGIILFLKGEIHTYLTSTKRAARVVFRQSAKQAKKEQKSEGIFFRESNRLKKRFTKDMPVIIRDVTEKYFDKVPSLRGSYLVTGEAGCGKSELLKNNFSKTYYRIRALQIFSFRRYGICFLESEDMINLLSQDASRQHFLEQLKNAKYKKLFLYIDGIDELTDI